LGNAEKGPGFELGAVVLEETADGVTLVQEWNVLLVVRDLRG
jgi:hypothetical protein